MHASGLQDLDDKVVERTKSKYSHKILLALQLDDAKLAREAYEWTQSIPQTRTCRELASKDIVIDGYLIGSNEYLEICFVDGRPSVLKTVTRSEFNRVCNLIESNVSHPNLVPVILETVETKYFVIMPLLPITAEHLYKIPLSTAEKLWTQIGSALQCLHDRGFAHKDVKSANICVDHNGNFILIDFGDTVEFGYKSSSTPEYVPSDIDAEEGASATIDWWMLAMTVYDRMQDLNCGLRSGTERFSTTSLKEWLLENGCDFIIEKLESLQL